MADGPEKAAAMAELAASRERMSAASRVVLALRVVTMVLMLAGRDVP